MEQITNVKIEKTRTLLAELIDNTGIYSEMELVDELSRRIDNGNNGNHWHPSATERIA